MFDFMKDDEHNIFVQIYKKKMPKVKKEVKCYWKLKGHFKSQILNLT